MDAWPSLPYREWKDTFETLRLWLQIAGKVRLVQSPWVNHQWHVTLYVTARGLTAHYREIFEITRLADHIALVDEAAPQPTAGGM